MTRPRALLVLFMLIVALDVLWAEPPEGLVAVLVIYVNGHT